LSKQYNNNRSKFVRLSAVDNYIDIILQIVLEPIIENIRLYSVVFTADNLFDQPAIEYTD